MRALEIIFGNTFLLFFLSFLDFFCVKRPDSMFGDVRTVILNVQTFMILVQTAVFLQPFTWHNVQTLLMFRPDGEPCRVKSFSPHAAAHFLASFCVVLSSCVFF
jgi:hypothetical protein